MAVRTGSVLLELLSTYGHDHQVVSIVGTRLTDRGYGRCCAVPGLSVLQDQPVGM